MSSYPPSPQYGQPTQYQPSPYTQQYAPMQYAPPARVRRRIRHVDVFSAVKVMAVLSMLIWAVFGLLYGICGTLFTAAIVGGLSSSSSSFRGSSGAIVGGNLAIFFIIYIVGIIGALIGGAISGAIYAGLYNVTANWTGGLEVDVE